MPISWKYFPQNHIFAVTGSNPKINRPIDIHRIDLVAGYTLSTGKLFNSWCLKNLYQLIESNTVMGREFSNWSPSSLVRIHVIHPR